MSGINLKRFFLWSGLVIFFDMIIGNSLYAIPIISNLYAKYEGLPSLKPKEFFGGIMNWVWINTGFSIVFVFFLLCFWIFIYKMLPEHRLLSGMIFGVLIWGIKAVPEAFNQWMLFTYPTILILTQLFVTLVSLIIFGIITSLLFRKLQVEKKA